MNEPRQQELAASKITGNKRKIPILLGGAFIATAALLAGSLLSIDFGGCDYVIDKKIVSNKSNAEVVEFQTMCGATSVDTKQLALAEFLFQDKFPSTLQPFFATDSTQQLEVSWAGDRQIIVKLSRLAHIYTGKEQVGEISVAYKYD